MNNYQKAATRTIKKDLSTGHLIQEAALGMTAEAGEVANHIRKICYQGHSLDSKYIIKELGDVLWYIAEMCTALNISLEEVATTNIDKLKKRYPNGFRVEDSINRKE